MWCVVIAPPAESPKAMLPKTVALAESAFVPITVLFLPVILFTSALLPMAALPRPLVLLKSANAPLAVLPPRPSCLRAPLPRWRYFGLLYSKEASQRQPPC